jgi:putative ABC transport system permease protein
MNRRHLIARGLRYYWRTNVAVALGVGVAVSALAGALVVGDSVRMSLRELAVARLGRADDLVTAATLFTSGLAERLATEPRFRAGWQSAVPLLALEGVVAHERSGSRAGAVQVYGVDNRFWSFNAIEGVTGPTGRDALLSPALARELGAAAGDALLLRVQKPSAIPAGLIQGRRSEPGRAIRLSAARTLEQSQLGDFSPRPQQGATRAIFVPLDRLQRELDLPDRVNVILAARSRSASRVNLQELVEQHADLADLGVRVRPLQDQSVALESDAGLISEPIERAGTAGAREVGVEAVPVLTYLATAIKANGREVPYSLVTAIPRPTLPPAANGQPPIWPGTPSRSSTTSGPTIRA